CELSEDVPRRARLSRADVRSRRRSDCRRPPRRAPRRRPARRDDAGHGRHGDAQKPEGGAPGAAGHHAVGPRERADHRRSPESRRGQLRREAGRSGRPRRNRARNRDQAGDREAAARDRGRRAAAAGERRPGARLLGEQRRHAGDRDDRRSRRRQRRDGADSRRERRRQGAGRARDPRPGAASLRVGKFEHADGGTLMLDEIGEMKPQMQGKLLHVLQDGEFSRLGSNKRVSADVRVLAATNRDLESMLAKSEFREDLYYRLKVIEVFVPPLRERRDEIPQLIEFFTARYAKRYNRREPAISQTLQDALLNYSWPGNVRE